MQSPDPAVAAPRIIDLEEFYRAREKPSRFLRALEAAARSSFPQDEMDRSVRALAECDPVLKRTVELSAQAVRSRDGFARRAVLAWTKHLVRLEVSTRAPLDEADQTTASRLFESIAARLKAASGMPLLNDTEGDSTASSGAAARKRRKLSEQRASGMTRLAFIWLWQERQLSPIDAARGFESILVKKKSRKATPSEVVALALIRGEDAAVRGVLAAFDLLKNEIDSSNHQLRAAQSREAEAEHAAEDANRGLHAAVVEADTLRAKVELTQTALARLERERETDLLGFRHAIGEIRARSLGFVRKKVKPLVDEALDALEGEPSHADVALDRLQSIKSRIAEEETWLAHSE